MTVCDGSARGKWLRNWEGRMDVKGDSGDNLGRSMAEKVSHCEYRVVDDQNLGRNRNVKGASGKVLKGKEEHVI